MTINSNPTVGGHSTPQHASGLPGVLVVVTGANGFVGSHCVRTLLERGYSVRGTVRGIEKHHWLYEIHPRASKHLQLVEADLLDHSPGPYESWTDLLQGATYLLHTASPVTTSPKIMVHTAEEGAKRIIAASAGAGLKRVVFTSSVYTISSPFETNTVASILMDHAKRILHRESFAEPRADVTHTARSGTGRSGRPKKRRSQKIIWRDASNFVEISDTTKKSPTRGLRTYQNSKIVSEQVCVNLAKSLDLELSVVIAPFLMGPILHTQHTSSVPGKVQAVLKEEPIESHRVARIFQYGKKIRVSMNAPYCDVRDIASVHVDLLEFSDAGHRLLFTVGDHHLNEIVDTVNNAFSCRAPLYITKKDKCCEVSKPTVHNDARSHDVYAANQRLLNYIPFQQSILDTARSLVHHGTVPKFTHE